MNIIKTFITVLVIGLFAVSALFIDFTYKTFSYKQSSRKADAIVVLAGGKGRVDEGIRLFRESRAEYLFLSEWIRPCGKVICTVPVPAIPLPRRSYWRALPATR